jgi:hypothetical protein
LAFITKFLNNTRAFSQINLISRFKKNSGVISDYDVVKTVIALITLSKTSFDEVEMYRGDKYFKRALNLKTVPSAVTIRQRLETYESDLWSVLRQINDDILYEYFSIEAVEINGKFSSNYSIMLLGMISFNLLRIASKVLFETKKVPGKTW